MLHVTDFLSLVCPRVKIQQEFIVRASPQQHTAETAGTDGSMALPLKIVLVKECGVFDIKDLANHCLFLIFLLG